MTTFPSIPHLASIVSKPSPGCYDDPDFCALEKRAEAIAFFSYAQHVRGSMNDSPKLVEHVIVTLRAMLNTSQLRANCVRATMLLCKTLERFGVWCCMVHGSVLIYLQGELTHTLHALDAPKFRGAFCGHVWLTCPPFDVVDLTVMHQHQASDAQAHVESCMPEIVLGRGLPAFTPTRDELTGDSLQPSIFWREVARIVPPCSFRERDLEVRYVPQRPMIPADTLEELAAAFGLDGVEVCRTIERRMPC